MNTNNITNYYYDVPIITAITDSDSSNNTHNSSSTTRQS